MLTIPCGDCENVPDANPQGVARCFIDPPLDYDGAEGLPTMGQIELREKAEKLIGMVQATMGLEGQAVDDDTKEQMILKTMEELRERPRNGDV